VRCLKTSENLDPAHKKKNRRRPMKGATGTALDSSQREKRGGKGGTPRKRSFSCPGKEIMQKIPSSHILLPINSPFRRGGEKGRPNETGQGE